MTLSSKRKRLIENGELRVMPPHSWWENGVLVFKQQLAFISQFSSEPNQDVPFWHFDQETLGM